MTRLIYEILDNLNEGIVILDGNFKIIHWNYYMENVTHIGNVETLGNGIIDILPNLNKKYFTTAFQDVKENGVVRFFSAAMHKDLINSSDCFNLKISRLDNESTFFLILEFINVTSQINQINQLKTYVNELWKANKELTEKEQLIRNLAYYDKLTGVANRTLFYEVANKLLSYAKRDQTLLGLMFIDVNKFKDINDTYGHEIGDQVLVQVATMLVKATRDNDVVARYGGDEFLVLLPNMKKITNFNVVVSRIIKMKNKTLVIGDTKIPVSLSIGISFYPNDGDTVDQLVISADAAMYKAKRSAGEDKYYCSIG
jgi:diguanylate cyclase (GGDEF) domain